MNESSHLLATLLSALGQLQNVKDKIDPEAYALLQQSAREAISSAHLFLDACEKVVDSYTPQDIVLEDVEEDHNVVDMKKSQYK